MRLAVPVNYSELPVIAGVFGPQVQVALRATFGACLSHGSLNGRLQRVTILLRLLLQNRAALAAEIRVLIRRMSRDNPTWGRRRIRSELHLLGYEVGELTVAKYRVRRRKPASQEWHACLSNYAHDIAAIDFL